MTEGKEKEEKKRESWALWGGGSICRGTAGIFAMKQMLLQERGEGNEGRPGRWSYLGRSGSAALQEKGGKSLPLEIVSGIPLLFQEKEKGRKVRLFFGERRRTGGALAPDSPYSFGGGGAMLPNEEKKGRRASIMRDVSPHLARPSGLAKCAGKRRSHPAKDTRRDQDRLREKALSRGEEKGNW